MDQILISTIIISLLHALIPNHSLPLIAIARNYNWSSSKLLIVTFVASLSHVVSTVVIGVLIAFIGLSLHEELSFVFQWLTPSILILLGIYFIYQHHIHNHFHLHTDEEEPIKFRKLLFWIVTAMFFSPCLEIEAIFFATSSYGWQAIFKVASIYMALTVAGMLFWVSLGYSLIKRFDSHKVEHNIGIITGVILILTGIAFFFVH